MAAQTVVFVTGVSRGLGRAIVAAYLARPNHTVIGSVRDAKSPKAEELTKSLPAPAEGSKLILVSIESTSAEDPKKAVEEAKAAGVDHIDIVIANAGVSPNPAPLDVIDTKVIAEAVDINALSAIRLWAATKELLFKSPSPKWVGMSSRPGTISQSMSFMYFFSAYGISKCAQNWITSTLHTANENLTAFAVHPGFVDTDMGQAGAANAGVEAPTTTPEESMGKLVEIIDAATREKTSGKWLDIMSGGEIGW